MAAELKTLIDDLLEKQQLLTPVTRFAQKHDQGEVPAQAKYYQDLIPLSKPQSGEQYAFQVNLDLCTACKACVTACHSLNGLEEEEIWRNVGFLHSPPEETPFQQTITTACHHCVDPGCLNGCPVEAYDKDTETGIVRHLDDQCIGCSYCVMKCPYDVPKYSKKKGIVRKCDMCHSRLSVGEAPACVQACPHEAIQIIIVDKEKIRNETKFDTTIVPDAPNSQYTLPTTRYISSKTISPQLQAADRYQLRAEEGHFPLALMLVLTQASVGLLTFDWVARLLDLPLSQPWSALVAVVLGAAGMVCATLHLGQPLKAWRFFLGLRHSWLSREILAFSLYLPTAAAYAFLLWMPEMTFLPEHLPTWLFASSTPLLVGGIPLFLGILSVFTSVMIYHDTTKPFWKFSRSMIKFYGSALVLGVPALVTCTWIWAPSFTEMHRPFLVLGILLVTLKIGYELLFLNNAKNESWSPDKRTALVLIKTLRFQTGIRFFLALFGGILIPLALLFTPESTALFWIALHGWTLLVASEIIERSLFFKAVSASKMPGTPL